LFFLVLVYHVIGPEVVAETTVAAKLEDEGDQDEDTCFQEADQFKEAELEVSNLLDKDTPMLPCFLPSPSEAIGIDGSSTTCGAGGSVSNSIAPSTTTNTFAGLFASATTSTTSQSRSLRDLIGVDPTFLCLAIGAPSSLFPQTSASNPGTFAAPPAPHMSATALLQKAAEVGASQSSSSFLKEFGLASSSTSSPPSKQPPQGRFTENSALPWHHHSNQHMEMERHRNHQQREMESSSQPCHHRSTQQMEMERRRNNQQREMESSLRRWHHHRSDQQMDMEHHRSNQQMQMESSTQRWPHHRSSQQMELMERHQWSSQQMERESRAMLSGGLGLGLAYESGNSGLPDLMMGPSPLFGPKPATLDFLGLGIGGTMGGSTANGGLPALMVGGELDMGSSAQVPAPWEDAKRKTNGRTIL